MSTPTVMRSLFFHRSKHTHLITAFNNNNNNHGIHCISVTRSLTVIQSSQYSTWRSNVWSRSVAELRRVQPRTTVVSRQRMILQRCWNKTIRRDQTYNIAASSSLSYCDLPRRALSSLKTSSSSSLERQQRQKLRKPTFQDVIYFQSILSNPHKSILTTLKPDNDNNSSKNSTSYENTATNADNDAHAKEKLSIYNTDWTNQYHGSSKLVLRPSSTHEISSILHYCHTNYIPIVPHGGNTGLCGGATPLIPPQDDDNNNNSSSNSSHNEIIIRIYE